MAVLYLWALACISLIIWVKRLSRNKYPFPPGPPAYPLIGHLWAITPVHPEIQFYRWGKSYGDVIRLHGPGRSWIILNSVQAAVDLLDKRSHNYSDRPHLPVFELMGWKHTLTLLPYGKQFQLHRRMMQEYFSRERCVAYRPIQSREARVLMQNLTSSPDRRDDILAQFATAIVIRIGFGHQITSDDDLYLQIAMDACHAIGNAGSPGGTPVDFFPFLQHFPSWFPGTYWANYAREQRAAVRKLHEFPYRELQEQMAKGTAKPSFIASQLENLLHDGADTQNTISDIQGAAGAIYVAGAETTWATLSIFFLAMVLHPECQVRAQEEIDRVIGSGRLPDFNDRDSLPYVECLLQETFRWNNAVPLGVPHRSLEDDVYNGMFIPKGSIIIANTRGMALDETVYADPFKFNPDRYLPQPAGNGEPYPTAQFGFGRRICPGRHLANASLWIAVATVLATLTVSKVIDGDGKEITPDAKFTPGGTSHPCPYRCNIQPRHKAAQSLITQADVSDYY